jgi:hypothetical protein
MANIDFMEKKYSLETLVTNYCEEIKSMRPLCQSPADEAKLHRYYQAANTFKRFSIMDLVQYALAWGRGQTGRFAQINEALSIVLANRIVQPSRLDLSYSRLLLDYTRAFKEHRGNLKEWMLRFVISSRFSPLHGYFDQAIDHVISDTQNKIISLEATL